jgi:YD repeat-containing protein
MLASARSNLSRAWALMKSTYAGLSVAATRYSYDQQPWNSVPLEGHATETQRWLNEEGRWLPSKIAYSAVGNISEVEDPTGRKTTTTYDPTYNIVQRRVLASCIPVEIT